MTSEPPQPNVYAPAPAGGRLWQGEILSNVIEIRRAPEELGLEQPTEVERLVHPYALVMTPDCDLEQDFNARQDASAPESRLVPHVLLCEVREAEELRGSRALTSKLWTRVRQNQDERYQYLHRVSPAEDMVGEGLPVLALDFKRILTLPTDELYAQIGPVVGRRALLVDRYLFEVMQRFYSFQSRVGVPVPHDVLDSAAANS